MSRAIYRLKIDHVDGDLFEASSPAGGRVLIGPKGAPEAFTPVELLLAGLAGCMGIDLAMVAREDGVALEGFTVSTRGSRPLDGVGLDGIRVEYAVDESLVGEVTGYLERVSEICTIGVTIDGPDCQVTKTVRAA